MRVIVTGALGQLGSDVVRELSARGHRVLGTDLAPEDPGRGAWDYAPLDITDGEAVRRVFGAFPPEAVIHCAAWTAVDLSLIHI